MTGWPPLQDTGIVVHYARDGLLSDWIEDHYHLRSMPDKPFISVITQGELYSLAQSWKWGEDRIRKLNELLKEFVILDINNPVVLQSYAETDNYAKSLVPSVNMQKNDLWIAATAHALGVTLMTTDTVFDHLHPEWIDRIYVDEKVVKPNP